MKKSSCEEKPIGLQKGKLRLLSFLNNQKFLKLISQQQTSSHHFLSYNYNHSKFAIANHSNLTFQYFFFLCINKKPTQFSENWCFTNSWNMFLKLLYTLLLFIERVYFLRSSHQRCSVRKGVKIEILQNSQENTCARVSFLITLLAWDLQLYLKKEALTQAFSLNFAKFLKIPFLQNTSGRLLLFLEPNALYKIGYICSGAISPKNYRLNKH